MKDFSSVLNVVETYRVSSFGSPKFHDAGSKLAFVVTLITCTTGVHNS